MSRRRENKTGASMQVFGYDWRAQKSVVYYSEYNCEVRWLRKQLKNRVESIRRDEYRVHCRLCGCMMNGKPSSGSASAIVKTCNQCKGTKVLELTHKYCRFCGETFTKEEAVALSRRRERQQRLAELVRLNYYRFLVCRQGYTLDQLAQVLLVNQGGVTNVGKLYEQLKQGTASVYRHGVPTNPDHIWRSASCCANCGDISRTRAEARSRALKKRIRQDELCRELRNKIHASRQRLRAALKKL